MTPTFTKTWFRRLVVLAVVILPALWWTKVAFVDDEVEMLVPSSCGDWVVHPEWDVVYRPALAFPPTIYRLEVPADVVEGWRRGESARLEVTAMGSFRVRLGRTECGVYQEDRGSWREPVAVDLSGCATDAATDGATELLILAQNDDGPSPVRACWPTAGPETASQDLPATGDPVWTALTPDRPWRVAARAGRGNSEMLDKEFAWPAGPWGLGAWGSGPWGYRLLLAGLALMALVGLVRGAGDETSEAAAGGAGEEGEAASARRDVPSWLVLAVVVAVNLWNAGSFPWQVSRIDQEAHAERIRYAAEHVVPQPADAAFQAYQPPLYYFVAGQLASLFAPGEDLMLRDDPEDLRPAQWLDAFTGIGHAFLVWWALLRFGPSSRRARALALAAVGLAPVALTTHPMLGNETLAGLLCGGALVAGVLWLPRGGVLAAASAGFLGGLALLTKYTGLMPVAALAVMAGARWLDQSLRGGAADETVDENVDEAEDRWLPGRVAAWLALLASLAAPFYVLRAERWGDPFVGNWSPQLGHVGEGEPGYRTPGFFLRFGEVFFHAPERGLWSSFWDGLYASTWGEINDSFLPIREPSVIALSLVLLALALVPTLAGVFGLASTARRAARSRPGSDLAFVAVTVFTVASVAVFTTQVPFHSTVKALFLLSLSVPAAVFVARGYGRMERGLGGLLVLLDVAMVLQILLVLRLFVWV